MARNRCFLSPRRRAERNHHHEAKATRSRRIWKAPGHSGGVVSPALLEAVGEASLALSRYCRLADQAMPQNAIELEVAEFVGRVKCGVALNNPFLLDAEKSRRCLSLGTTASSQRILPNAKHRQSVRPSRLSSQLAV